MSISIQTNVTSLVAQNNLSLNNIFQQNTITQLTSGYRINKSGDDAAGLAIANTYRNNLAEMNQGILNANSAVSQLQIVDGGLSNISQMLDRLKTLSAESASGTFTGNRSTLDNEYQTLLTEIDRQANNIGLGSTNTTNMQNLSVYIGGGQDANTNSSVNIDLTKGGVGSVDLGLNGTSLLTAGKVTVGTQAAVAVAAAASETFTVGTASGSQVITINGQNGDTVQGQVQELNAQLAVYGITASLDATGKLQMQSGSAFTVLEGGQGGLTAAADHATNTGLINSSYTSGVAESLKVTVGGTTATIALAGTETQDQAAQIINAGLKAAGITGVTAVTDENTAAGVSLESASAFTATHGAGNTALTINAATSIGNPNVAINAVTAAVQALGTVQGIVGAGENDLQYAIQLAQSQVTNYSAAQSAIRDADIAAQAANLTKAQVLQQASMAAMAQANSSSSAVLKLFQ